MLVALLITFYALFLFKNHKLKIVEDKIKRIRQITESEIKSCCNKYGEIEEDLVPIDTLVWIQTIVDE